MAVLSDPKREECRSEFCSDVSAVLEAFSVSDADASAAFAAIDQWVVDNQGSYNTALPLAFRNAATSAQKAQSLMIVVRKRFLEGV